MTEDQAIKRMVAPGTPRAGKWRQGVIQIWVTRACDNACFGCTQGSNLAGKPGMITVEQFEQACVSLKGYLGVVGMFGGNPATHPKFPELCEVMRKHVPQEQRGLWCNNPLNEKNGRAMRETFNPRHSNLNCHLSKEAYDNFKRWWPESMPFGLDRDSRHSPVHLAMKDVIADEGERWKLIANCDINQHWSAMIGVFRGQLRAWFCEVAGAQSMLHQDEEDYPDTGIDPTKPSKNPFGGKPVQWWEYAIGAFYHQIRKHCHECGVPLRGYGELAMAKEGVEQTSETHRAIFKPKREGHKVEVVTELVQLGTKRVGRVIDYVKNASS